MRPVQRLDFGEREPKHEVLAEACSVALDLFVEALGGDPVEGRWLCIEQRPLAAQDFESYDTTVLVGT